MFFFSPKDVCKPGWSYFNGICYSTSQSCKNWTDAQKTCQAYSANLITVRNQEENVYIQHRLNGAKGWIGLNDMEIEGTFVWADNKTNNFTYWAKNQPNDLNNQDCVHTLGVRHSFMWNDVSCGTCYNYTCSEGIWEHSIVSKGPIYFLVTTSLNMPNAFFLLFYLNGKTHYYRTPRYPKF